MTTTSIRETTDITGIRFAPYEFQGVEKLWQDFTNAIEQFKEDKP